MDKQEREELELLYRVDERTNILIKDITRLSKDMTDRLDRVLGHQERQNKSIEMALLLATSNKTSIKWIKGAGVLLVSGLFAIVGFFIKLFQN